MNPVFELNITKSHAFTDKKKDFGIYKNTLVTLTFKAKMGSIGVLNQISCSLMSFFCFVYTRHINKRMEIIPKLWCLWCVHCAKGKVGAFSEKLGEEERYRDNTIKPQQ